MNSDKRYSVWIRRHNQTQNMACNLEYARAQEVFNALVAAKIGGQVTMTTYAIEDIDWGREWVRTGGDLWRLGWCVEQQIGRRTIGRG